ncbi:MAG TPA: GNAT family N-acetyltransferase [Bacteriovoracaceae bacterium]|nr:GNAT family N-acetyltransferase [Bacteriovoracaceae bacterium]
MIPGCIGNYLDLIDEDNASYPGSDELLSIGASVGKKLGLKKIGIHIETIFPGRRTSWPHAESAEEEFAFVIEGHPEVWLDGSTYPLRPGDFVAFPCGTGMAHTFINNSSLPVKLLVGGEARNPSNKIVYPLHPDRNRTMKEQEKFWDAAPTRVLGPHDGKPDLLREETRPRRWNLPVLKTEKLLLRPLEMGDAEAIFEYASNPLVSQFVTWSPHKSLEDSRGFVRFVHSNYLQHIPDAFGVCRAQDPEVVIGTVGAFWGNLKAQKILELGIVLSPRYWGQGMIKEALEFFLPYLWKNFDVNRIQARCLKENIQSRRLLEKIGMKHEGLLRSGLFCKGESRDLELFSLVRAP